MPERVDRRSRRDVLVDLLLEHRVDLLAPPRVQHVAGEKVLHVDRHLLDSLLKSSSPRPGRPGPRSCRARRHGAGTPPRRRPGRCSARREVEALGAADHAVGGASVGANVGLEPQLGRVLRVGEAREEPLADLLRLLDERAEVASVVFERALLTRSGILDPENQQNEDADPGHDRAQPRAMNTRWRSAAGAHDSPARLQPAGMSRLVHEGQEAQKARTRGAEGRRRGRRSGRDR